MVVTFSWSPSEIILQTITAIEEFAYVSSNINLEYEIATWVLEHKL
jgi:hypothetical protein